jgi:glyoxylate reductase
MNAESLSGELRLSQAKIYVSRNWFPEVLNRMASLHEMKVWEGEDAPPRDVLLNELKDIEGLLPVGTPIDAEIMNAAPKLRVISNFGDGVDHIDVAEATRRRIPVGHTPDVLTETTADLALALLLASARRIVEGDTFVRREKWKTHAHMELPGVDVNHATLGLVGLGKIGIQVAKRARAFNMRVIYYSRNRKFDMESILGLEYFPDLHSLLAESDFISLHTPLTNETRRIIGAAEFAAMKPTAILVNTARGAVVDQQALYQALETRQIQRAAIDVTEIEPIPPDDPLLSLDNLIIMPHIGSAVPDVRKKMMMMAVDHVLAGLRGERMAHCVNPSVYDSVPG